MRSRKHRNRHRAVFVTSDLHGVPTGRVPDGTPDPLVRRYERGTPLRLDPAVLAAAMAEADAVTVPLCPTGRCHTCDRKITGERIYCGPCLAARLRDR